eukprot:364377-Chlamydomonas_euryale.AAC.2
MPCYAQHRHTLRGSAPCTSDYDSDWTRQAEEESHCSQITVIKRAHLRPIPCATPIASQPSSAPHPIPS